MGTTGTTSKTDRRVRILIADDHPVIRNAVRTVLEVHPQFDVCGEARDGAKAIEEAQKLKPDVVVLNVTMPVLDGFEAARKIKSSLPQTAIVILSLNADHRFVEEAKKSGAQAYVAKTKIGDELIKAIEAAVKGGDFVLVETVRACACARPSRQIVVSLGSATGFELDLFPCLSSKAFSMRISTGKN